MNDGPLVSVIIPAYNSARYLPETLGSVLSQEGPSFEVIVVDDASTDDTVEALKPFAGRISYHRLDRNTGGPAVPRNRGLSLARGRYAAFFDSDDLMMEGNLRRKASFLEGHPEIPFVFSNFMNLHPDGREDDFLADHEDFHRMPKSALGEGCYRLESAKAFETLIADNYIGTSGVLFRKRLAEELGGMNESLVNSDDIEFFFRVAHRHDLGFIDKAFHKRRLHAANISSRPYALQQRLSVRLGLRRLPLSAAAGRELNRSIARLHYSIGYSERTRGKRLSSIKHFLQSWWREPFQVRALKSFARALLPF